MYEYMILNAVFNITPVILGETQMFSAEVYSLEECRICRLADCYCQQKLAGQCQTYLHRFVVRIMIVYI